MEKKLKDLKGLASYLDGKNDLPISKYTVETEIEKLEKSILLHSELNELKALGKYSISKYFELVVEFWNSELNLRIALKDEYQADVYNDFICSYSGINEWVEQHTQDVYDFMTGNSGYNHALGTVTLGKVLKGIRECEDAEKIKVEVDKFVNYFNNNDFGKKVSTEIDHILDVSLKFVKDAES